MMYTIIITLFKELFTFMAKRIILVGSLREGAFSAELAKSAEKHLKEKQLFLT